MQDFLIILFGIITLIILILIFLYNRLDRKRFFLDRLLKKSMPSLDEWVRLCAEIHPGCEGDYFQLKKNWQKTSCIQSIIRSVPENSEEKLDQQESLLEFTQYYSQRASEYNELLENGLYRPVAKLFAFKPYAEIDFYPDITLRTIQEATQKQP